MRKHEVDALPFRQRLDHGINRGTDRDEDEEAAEAAEMDRIRESLLLNRPKFNLDLDEFMRSLPKRSYTRRKPKGDTA